MSLKSYKPVTPSLRFRRTLRKDHLHPAAPYKPLTHGLSKSGGRNTQGRITVYHRGGGHKRTYRSIDFNYTPTLKAIVERIEYDPNRSASIALIREGTHYSYIIASEGLEPGMEISTLGIQLSARRALHQFPLGSKVHNIELYPGSGGKLKRAAGTYATLLSITPQAAILLLSPNHQITLSPSCYASFGRVSNLNHKNYVAGKAGVTRWLGHRPTVKGSSMNPVDHPHGGKTKRGFLPRTPWGKITRGKKTT
jgi:large subunit ribosomal protein L2